MPDPVALSSNPKQFEVTLVAILIFNLGPVAYILVRGLLSSERKGWMRTQRAVIHDNVSLNEAFQICAERLGFERFELHETQTKSIGKKFDGYA